MKISGIVSKAKSAIRKSSPTVLTCIGAIGTVATAIMAVKATPKALEILELHQRDEGSGIDGYDLSKSEIVKLTWKCYLPAAIIGVSAIACMFGANMLSRRNQASIAGAYALLNQSYKKYRNAAKTVFGEDADSKIQAQIAKDAYVSADGYSIYSSEFKHEGDCILCYDMYSNRYFQATMAAVVNAQYHMNRNLMLRGYTNFNEFYEFLGIDGIGDAGDATGWCMDELMEGGIMWIDFDNSLTVMEDDVQCCVISALWAPITLQTE